MRAFRFLNLGLLAATVASSAVLYAQDEKQQEDKPRQEEPKRQDQTKPAARQDEAKAPRQDEMKAPPRQDDAKPTKPQEQEQRQDQAQPRQETRPQQVPERQENGRQVNGREENRQPAGEPENHARPAGNGGGRIPEDRFRAQFGRSHHFPMQRPEVVEGRPRFEYSGYTFVLVDPWPPEWAYSDDCYIDDVDGEYFLFDMRHPGAQLALILVM
jgi:hypothetical protein